MDFNFCFQAKFGSILFLIQIPSTFMNGHRCFSLRHSLDKKEDIWQLEIRVSSPYDYSSFASHISGLYKNYEMHQWELHVMGYHD